MEFTFTLSNVFTYVWMILIYGFAGFVISTVYTSLKNKKFCYEGILTLPICPIYGFVMVALVETLRFFPNVPIFVKIIVAIIASILYSAGFELILGYVLNKNFNKKWWTHEKEKYNFKGYIGLIPTLLYGASATLVYFLLQPSVEKLINHLATPIGVLILSVIIIILLIDIIWTVLEITFISRKITAVDKLDELFGKVKGDESELDTLIRLYTVGSDDGDEINLLNALLKYKAPITSNSFTHKRLIGAYPDLADTTKLDGIIKYQKVYTAFKKYKIDNHIK